MSVADRARCSQRSTHFIFALCLSRSAFFRIEFFHWQKAKIVRRRRRANEKKKRKLLWPDWIDVIGGGSCSRPIKRFRLTFRSEFALVWLYVVVIVGSHFMWKWVRWFPQQQKKRYDYHIFCCRCDNITRHSPTHEWSKKKKECFFVAVLCVSSHSQCECICSFSTRR